MRKKLPVISILIILFIILIFAKITSSPSSEDANSQFESFTEELFRQELSSNTLNLHYTLQNPTNYDIQPNTVTLGTYETDSILAAAAIENCLAILQKFSYQNLSRDNQITYDILTSYFQTSLDSMPYTLYEEPLSPLTGTQSQLPILLSEYQFYNSEDISTYLSLLKNVPNYFESIIKFEQAKADAGLFMPDTAAKEIAKECEDFIAMGESSYLHSTFQTRLDKLDFLTTDQTQNYIEQNRQYLETYVFPSYQKLADEILALQGTGVNSGGLCHFADGISYYEHLVHEQTGSNRSVIELKELTLNQIKDDLSAIREILTSYQNPSAESDLSSDTNKMLQEISSFTLENADPTSILCHLKDKMSTAFPTPPDVNIEVKFVQEEMEEYLSPAFYMIPAIDNIENNVIYINQGHIPDDLDLFTTLAHEGYPGHLYQTTYFGASDPDPIRSLLNFGGYTEGWAVYTENISYYFSTLPKEQATLLQRNSSIILGLYALADIGIHYDGWTLLDTIAFFHEYGIDNTETIQSIYELIIGDPANYLKYYIGYVEFLELKKYAIDKWGDNFSQRRFHQAVLEIGPAPFDIVKKYLQ